MRPTSLLSRLSRALYSTAAPRATTNGSRIAVDWPNGSISKFHHEYLLDHCRCSKCFHPVTKQRLKTLADFDHTVKTSSIKNEGDQVVIEWQNGHVSSFPWKFLAKASYDPPLRSPKKSPVKLWSAHIAKSPPVVNYEALMAPGREGESSVLKWLDLVAEFGFCFVAGVPVSPTATEEVIRRIAPIRQTHYGAFWDFTADMALGDLAYSNQALPAHTDTTYFSDPAGLQIFHMLAHDGQGGESLLVDGFYTASRLSKTAYDVLSRFSIPTHASGNPQHQLRPRPQPSLIHDDQGDLVQVRWNNEDRGILGQGWKAEDVENWYSAAREFEQINRSPDSEYWFKLEPGTMVVIDNWRVMHGRAAFNGSRRMCGAYIGADDWHSRRRALQREGASHDDWAWGW